MTTRLPTPPPSPSIPQLVLCADGGGSKVCVVIRSNDGVEVKGIAGPCNIQSVGYEAASQSLLLATYRALSQLSTIYLPTDLYIPSSALTSTDLTKGESSKLPNLNIPIFQYAWLGLAGVNCESDAKGFMSHATGALCLTQDRIKLSNDVNLLAAPALDIPGIDHVVAVVAGTGTIGRTIRVSPKISDQPPSKKAGLPLEDVAIARGWGYLLCDEGSAFWLGRLAIRSVLAVADRHASSSIYSTPTLPLLPLHQDILEYFGTADPADLINLASLSHDSLAGLDIGQATAKRNAMIAGAARVVLKWAFPEDAPLGRVSGLPTPPGSEDGSEASDIDMESESECEAGSILELSTPDLDLERTPRIPSEEEEMEMKSQMEAMKIVSKSIQPLIELTLECLGDSSEVKLERTVLVLGGGLMSSRGYRKMLLDGLARSEEKVRFKRVMGVDDPAVQGARAVGRMEFGH
ncbi:hypothetical protein I302_104516 [Kwoniella bestiolae CBS 10118]|uniref:N-acetyl-D-glucosamine kinase n=1 Tax=Kwoniella bestiolae CBS 10118 TaxID=1296100 RepID=A0A1B9GBG9_9TREE|nr:hypothetical protein I302_03222 [Kwoniella bestiolae CBS 10118]OCF28363.1 hypothetical protein I302_03222 [Kwoniella bestiolae CBS 10118]